MARPRIVSGAKVFGRTRRVGGRSGLSKMMRAKALFVVRESDKWDLELFNGMREQTYQNSRHIRAVDAIRQVGLIPMTSNFFKVQMDALANENGLLTEEPVETVEVKIIYEGSTKAFLFSYRGYYHLWSQASAHKTELTEDDGRENPFTTILIDVINELHPRTVYAANLSRLVRSMAQGNRLAAALDGKVDRLIVREMKFDLTGNNSNVAFMFLTMLSWVAAMERDAIVTRMLTGRIAKWRRGEWPLGKRVVPFGYRLDASKRLQPDLLKRAAVREMMIILASDLPNSEKQRQLIRLEVPQMRVALDDGITRFPISLSADPETTVTTLMSWAPIWVQGEYLFRTQNPFPTLDELSGIEVVRNLVVDDDGEDEDGDWDEDDWDAWDDDWDEEEGRSDDLAHDDPGEFQLLNTVPLPEGGWAEPEVVQAFANAATIHTQWLLGRGRNNVRPLSPYVQNTSVNPYLLQSLLSADRAHGQDAEARSANAGSRAKTDLAPLVGLKWTDEDGDYFEIMKNSTDLYKLVRWLKKPFTTSIKRSVP